MKKLFLVLLFIISVFALNSCGFLFGGEKEDELVDVEIVYSDTSDFIEVEVGSTKNITPRYKNGKVLIGFYGDESGNGKEYINFKGTMNQSWKSDYPTKIYAVYEELDYSKKHTSSIIYDESPKSFYCSYDGSDYVTCAWSSFKKSTTDFAAILYSNPNLELRVTFHAMLNKSSDAGSNPFDVRVRLGYSEELLATKTYTLNSNSWQEISISTTLKAKQFTSDVKRTIYAGFYSCSLKWALVKNAYYTLSIVQ